MQDEFAEWEREEIARRTQDGLLEKCRSGLVIKRKRAAYGYRASEDGNAVEVAEPEMKVVRRISRSVAEGVSVRSVRLALEQDGIPAPSGIGRWNHTTIRNIIASELYAPHTYGGSRCSWSRGWRHAWAKEPSTDCGRRTRARPRGARYGTRRQVSSRSATTTSQVPGKSGSSCRCPTRSG